MSINDVDQMLTVEESPREIPEPVNRVTGPALEEMEMNAMKSVLGSDDPRYENDMKILLDYAKTQTDDHSPESLRWAIRELEIKLGTPPYLEDRIKYMSRYAYLLNEGKKINKEVNQMMEGGHESI